VWAELGAALPHSGGAYYYLSEAFGREGPGRLMSFLFLWQLVISLPLGLASGAVGFSQYAQYLWPAMSVATGKWLAVLVCLASAGLIYRRIESIGKLSIAIWFVVMGAALWIVVDGLLHARVSLITDLPKGALDMNGTFWTGLGGATLYAAYDYGGYNTVCYLGGEVAQPARTIPRAILGAIGLLAVLYITMNTTIIGVVPWREAIQSKFIVSDFIARLHGRLVAEGMTVLILITAFASVFAGMLGASRVPWAAAKEGQFFRPFARLHPTGEFPSFGVLYFGIASAAGCALELDALVKALTVIQTLIQSLAVVVAVMLLRKTQPKLERPFRMWGYPFTAAIALAGWTYVIVTSGAVYIASAMGMLAVGVGAYLWRARARGEWPWAGEGGV
jgi:amino acid transporter